MYFMKAIEKILRKTSDFQVVFWIVRVTKQKFWLYIN